MKQSREITNAKLALIVISTIIGTAVTTAVGLVRVANSDHFTVIALSTRVDTLEDVVVSRNEFNQRSIFIDSRLDRIESKIDRLLER